MLRPRERSHPYLHENNNSKWLRPTAVNLHFFNMTLRIKYHHSLSLSLSTTMMKITIVMKCCKFSMDVATHEPILQIKKRIQCCLGIPSDSQTLTVCDWELIDGLDLDDYPLITDGTNIHLSTTIDPPVSSLTAMMKITVKFSARKLEIEVIFSMCFCKWKIEKCRKTFYQ